MRQDKKLYAPDIIYADEEALNYYFCRKVLKTFSHIEPVIISKEEQKRSFNSLSGLNRGKKALYLKRYQGTSFKLCPGFSDDLLCCGYYVIDLVENCPLECVYCILRVFLNKPVITFHVNAEEIAEEIRLMVKENPQRHFRAGTGEHSDSLALDHIFQVNPYLIEVFSQLPNATLELKTKTADIEALTNLNHGGRTVLAWSLNPPEIIGKYELKTASLEERLKAASKAVEAGYKTAFHYDPIIYYEGWEKGYKQTAEMMLDVVAPENIAWISLGTLRYIPALKRIAEERFPRLSIFADEFINAEDGKKKYLKVVRRKLLGAVAGYIKKAAPQIPLYICMEKRSIWKRIMDVRPSNSEELELYLSSGASG